MARRPVLPESRLRARKRKRARIIAGSAALLCLLLGSGVVYVLHQPFVRVESVSVAGAQTIQAASLSATAKNALSGSYFGIVPRDSIFFYPREALLADVRAHYPELAAASASRSSFSSLSLSISEREPAALWCGEVPATSSPCMLMDSGGLVYAPAPQFSAPVYLPYYGPLAGENAGVPALPRQFLTPAEFRSLAPLVSAIAERAGGEVAYVAVDANGDARSVFASGFEVRFSLGGDAGKVLQYFSLALSSAPFQVHPLSDFEYLDLRFGGKLYYKLR